MSHLSHRLLPAVLIAAVACCGERSGASEEIPVYQFVDRQCSAFFDAIADWKDAPAARRPFIAQGGAAAAVRLAFVAMQRRTSPEIEEFEKLASTTRDVVATRALVASVMRQAMEARPPQAITDPKEARVNVADYAAYCTFGGIASLQTRIAR